MYVIQSNINHKDFQSLMYKVSDLTWEEFKEYILSENHDKTFIGTMAGATKLKNSKYVSLDINDEHHLRVKITRPDGFNHITEYYLVTDENFQNLIR